MTAPSSALTRVSALAGIGVLALTACGNQATTEAQDTTSASASATTVSASPSPSPTPSVTSTPAAETVSAQPTAEETTPEAPVTEAPETTEAAEQPVVPEATVEAVQGFDQEAYRTTITSERIGYEFEAAGVDCYVYAESVSCWRPAVEFTMFPVETASLSDRGGYRFEAIPEVNPALVMTEKLELPVNEQISIGASTCVNTGSAVHCSHGSQWFEINGTTITPTPDILLNQ